MAKIKACKARGERRTPGTPQRRGPPHNADMAHGANSAGLKNGVEGNLPTVA
jgi:hypothetical protein